MKKIALCALSLLLFSQARSQTKTACASTLDLNAIKRYNPERYQRMLALEEHTQRYISNAAGQQNARLVNANGTIVIPVVVHVLHRGEAVGTGRNISDAQIQSQIAVLNEDFRRLNADRFNTPAVFQPLGADANFEFRLACIDPAGNATNGITRTFAGVTQFNPLSNINSDGSINEQNTRIKFTNQGGRDAWPTNRYLNIWVCDMGGGLIGYAQFPDEYAAKPNTDGVVMLFNAFGRVGNLLPGLNQGRVCVHEIGHWLNLRHIWGDQNCGNDQVNDTPVQQAPNTGCPTFPRVTCGNGPNGDMFMNYMDYTNNGCQNIFTAGQSARMRAVFAQGGPRAAFIDNYFQINAPANAICATGTVTVRNPLCLPVTWSIVSGNATITGGQGTNTASVQTTGSGTFRIRATAGNYTDERDISHGAPLYGIITPYLNYCLGGSDWELGLQASSPDPTVTTYQWSRDGVPAGSGSTWYTYEFPPACMTIGLRAGNACGLSPEGTQVFCPPCGFRLSVSPNPVKGQMNITLGDDVMSRKVAPDGMIVFTLVRADNPRVNHRWTFKGLQKRYTINLTGVSKGIYILEMRTGELIETRQVVVE